MPVIKQQGSVLLISLMLLIVLTLMTFTISNSVLLQGKMTGSIRDDTLALQVAESALNDAERFVNTRELADYTLAGNQGLYDGQCDIDDASCYLNIFDDTDFDIFSALQWVDNNSRAATTPVACPFGDACPLPDRYQPGRFKVILLGDVDLTLSGSERIRQITNQYQDQADGAAPQYMLYRVIASGTGVDPNNRRVIVSHFAAPLESEPEP